MCAHDAGLGPSLTLTAVTVYLSVGTYSGTLDTSLGAALAAAAELNEFHLAWDSDS